jgi:hypothetical protein
LRPEHVREQLDTIAARLGRQFTKADSMLRDVRPGISAFADFPAYGTSVIRPNRAKLGPSSAEEVDFG